VVDEAGGECMCPECARVARDLPAVHPDTVIQLAEELPGEGGEA
jgi:hypothetical protein